MNIDYLIDGAGSITDLKRSSLDLICSPTPTITWGKCGKLINLILFLSFRRVLNVIYSFLGNSPASEF